MLTRYCRTREASSWTRPNGSSASLTPGTTSSSSRDQGLLIIGKPFIGDTSFVFPPSTFTSVPRYSSTALCLDWEPATVTRDNRDGHTVAPR